MANILSIFQQVKCKLIQTQLKDDTYYESKNTVDCTLQQLSDLEEADDNSNMESSTITLRCHLRSKVAPKRNDKIELDGFYYTIKKVTKLVTPVMPLNVYLVEARR